MQANVNENATPKVEKQELCVGEVESRNWIRAEEMCGLMV